MLIELKTDQNSESSGVEETQMSFDTSKTAKLFHMLSNTLYSDKPSSVIRELSSNAYDSHKKAGKLDVPFELVAPTYENPTLIVRDFGTGLTEEEARRTILCYLGSDKDGTDEFIGGWGIGSKSPFAYATTYDVIVTKGFKFTHFTCWKDENGIPKTAVMDSGDSILENGVEMRVPVDTNDISRFSDAVERYMNWTNYNVRGFVNENEYVPRVAIGTVDTDEYSIKLYEKGTGERRLVYGGFSYPMDQCVDNRWDYTSHWRQTAEKMRETYDIAIVLHKPNAVSFNMNREVLEQTEKSRKFVEKVVTHLFEVSTTREATYKEFSKDWLSNKASTLAELQETIDAITARWNKEDSVFNRAFKTGSLTFRYDIKGSTLYGLSAYRNPAQLHNISIELAPIEDQIVIHYGRLLSVPPAVRQTYAYGTKKGTFSLYIKANSLEDAKKYIKESADFSGFDVEKLNFVFVDIPKRVKAAKGTAVLDRNPRPYNKDEKSYHRWSVNTVFVCDDGIEYDKKDLFSASLGVLLGGAFGKKMRDVVVFNTSKHFRGQQEFYPNIMDRADFIEAYAETGREFAKNCLVSSRELMDLSVHIPTIMQNVVYRSNISNSMATEYYAAREKVSDFAYTAGIATKMANHIFKEELASTGFEDFFNMGKGYNSPLVNHHKNLATKIISRVNRNSKLNEYLNLDDIEKGHGENDKVAQKIRSLLMSNNLWFE